MKRTLINILLIFAICLIVVGCDSNSTIKNLRVSNNNSSVNLNNVTKENYQNVVKNVLGIIVEDQKGLNLEEVNKSTGENSLRIKYKIADEQNIKDVIKGFFEQSLELSKQIVYSYGLNEEMTSMIKKEKYSSFDNYATDNLNEVYGLYQAIWVYNYDKKEILFSVNIDEEEAVISFTIIS